MIAQERRWATGGRGEEAVARALARSCPAVAMLHDRCIPGQRANIDHIAVAASGVYVIDTKRYRGRIEVRGALFGSPTLRIAGRDQSKLVDGLARQIAAVQTALADAGLDAAVHGCFCFVAPEGLFADAGLPLLRTLQVNGYRLFKPRRLARYLNRPGPYTAERVSRIQRELAARLPPA